MYHSDSDESIRRYNLDQQILTQQYVPQSSLSLNQMPNYGRRLSNPDAYPGARRFSTSYSDEDILSNDQLDQIHFDPRYRDYRSSSSVTTCNYRIRSNSLHSMGSGTTGGCVTPQYQPYRRVSSVSPLLNPLTIPVPLAPQRRWNTNPSIFIEEYRDDENPKSSSETKSEKVNSHESLCNTSNDSLQPALSENDIKSFGDLDEIPFIDEDSNESAPCRMFEDNEKIEVIRPCRKTVSFDVIQKSGNNFPPKFLKSNFFSPHKNPPLSHAALPHTCRTMMRNDVRTTRDGYVARSQSQPSVTHPFSTSSSSDHCSLVDKLIKFRMEEEVKSENNENCPRRHQHQHHHCHQCSKVKCSEDKDENDNDSSKAFRSGKVKALTMYFNTLPYMSEECNCIKKHQSTPNLISSAQHNRLSCEELTEVKEQLEEWSEFGLREKNEDNNLVCSTLKHAESAPILCFDNEIYDDFKEYRETLNRLDKVRMKRLNETQCPHRCVHSCQSINHKLSMPSPPKPQTRLSPLKTEKHRCRSACFNPKRKLKIASKLKIAKEDDNESLVI